MKLNNLFLTIFLFFSVSVYSNDYIVIQSTTSIANTGLLDLLASEFKSKTGIKVRPIAVGTGNAIANAKRGDGDLLFVHSKKDELDFIKDGYGLQRYEVMYNKFILVGPKSDPLKLSSEDNVLSALKKIFNSEYKFISRDDNSGTHKKEQELWHLANIKKFNYNKYIKTGTSMANTLNIASELNAYTISDKGTWLSFRNKNNLKILFEGGDELHNPYGIIAVNPEKFPHVEYKKSQKFIEWLITGEGKDIIDKFKYNGEQLFYTD